MNETLWKILYSLWIIPTLIIFINGLPLIFVGLHAKQNKWIIIGILAEMPIILFSVLYSLNIDWLNMLLALLILLSVPFSFVYSLTIRNKYYELLKTRKQSKNINEYSQQIQKPDNNIIPENIKSYSRDLNDVGDNNKIITKLDINKASVDEIKLLPGVNNMMAEKIVSATNEGKKFNNMDELADFLDIAPNHMKDLVPYIKFGTHKNPSSGRRLDL